MLFIRKAILIVYLLFVIAVSLFMVVMSVGAAPFHVALLKLLADIVFIASIIFFIIGKKVHLWLWAIVFAFVAYLWIFYMSSASPLLIGIMLIFIIPPSIMGFVVSRSKA